MINLYNWPFGQHILETGNSARKMVLRTFVIVVFDNEPHWAWIIQLHETVAPFVQLNNTSLNWFKSNTTTAYNYA